MVKVEPDSVDPTILNWLQEGDWCAENGDLLHWSIETKMDQHKQKVSGRTIFNGGTGQFKKCIGIYRFVGSSRS